MQADGRDRFLTTRVDPHFIAQIQTEAREEMGKVQHDYYLRQQLKAISASLAKPTKPVGS